MNYFEYLKKRIAFYAVSGIIAGLVLCTVIAVHRYNSHMSRMLSDMELINLNSEKVKAQIQDIDGLGEYFMREFNLDVRNVNTDGSIYRALDEITSNLQEAVITVGRSEKNRGKKELSVAVNAPMRDYNMILDYVQYLESFRVPDYEIREISITREQSGKVSLRVQGGLVIPLLNEGASS